MFFCVFYYWFIIFSYLFIIILVLGFDMVYVKTCHCMLNTLWFLICPFISAWAWVYDCVCVCQCRLDNWQIKDKDVTLFTDVIENVFSPTSYNRLQNLLKLNLCRQIRPLVLSLFLTLCVCVFFKIDRHLSLHFPLSISFSPFWFKKASLLSILSQNSQKHIYNLSYYN